MSNHVAFLGISSLVYSNCLHHVKASGYQMLSILEKNHFSNFAHGGGPKSSKIRFF